MRRGLPERPLLKLPHTDAAKRRAEKNSAADHGHQARITEIYIMGVLLWLRLLLFFLKHMSHNHEIFLAFIDLEKAYDSVPHSNLWKFMADMGSMEQY